MHIHTPLGCLAVGISSFIAANVGAQDEPASPPDAELPPPFTLVQWKPDQPVWAALQPLREAESTYRDSAQWWSAYAQLRAAEEAMVGNHAAALALWDAGLPSREQSEPLPEDVTAVDAAEYIASRAAETQVVMINERHHAASDRLLTLELLSLLYDRGYRYFAAEAFNEADSALNDRGYPLLQQSGTYTSEVVFGEVIREALRLGYTLVPYEYHSQEVEEGLTRQQMRDRGQARNLAERILEDDPEAKIFVHAGFAHIRERANESWHPMAAYFREMTGIDPLTIDQTRMCEGSKPKFEAAANVEAIERGLLESSPVILLDSFGEPFAPIEMPVDLVVMTPRTQYTQNRPDWMTLGDRRIPFDVLLPDGVPPGAFVEARRPDEPEDAVPLDRAEITDAKSVQVFIPRGKAVSVRFYSPDGAMTAQREYAFSDE